MYRGYCEYSALLIVTADTHGLAVFRGSLPPLWIQRIIEVFRGSVLRVLQIILAIFRPIYGSASSTRTHSVVLACTKIVSIYAQYARSVKYIRPYVHRMENVYRWFHEWEFRANFF